jgi:muramoyltetrapeptide carboxypeptidase
MQLRKPRALRPGDGIGIVSTSSPATPDQLDRLISYLGGRGYAVKVADGVLDRHGYLGGRAEQRTAGVMRMFADPEVALVMPVSGGEGAGHLVDRLDYGLIGADPKLFTGFSDPSVLNNSLLAAAGLPSVHGVSGFQFFGWAGVDEPTESAFWRMVTGPIAGLEVPGQDWRAHRADVPAVSGPVVGGTLWAVSALAGTRWMPSTAGAIVLLESVPAPYAEVDRLLTHLRLAGVFDDIAALVIGAPADWAAEDAPDTCTDELILRCVRGRFPVITGVEFGHQERKIQFPVGCRVEFDLGGSRPVLRYLEDLVRPAE